MKFETGDPGRWHATQQGESECDSSCWCKKDRHTHSLAPAAIEKARNNEITIVESGIGRRLTEGERHLVTLGFTAGIQYGLRHSAEVVGAAVEEACRHTCYECESLEMRQEPVKADRRMAALSKGPMALLTLEVERLTSELELTQNALKDLGSKKRQP